MLSEGTSMAERPEAKGAGERAAGRPDKGIDGLGADGSRPDPRTEAPDTANRAVKERIAEEAAGKSATRQALLQHPVGVAGGAVAGLAAGAIGGMAAGPVGSLFGALAGAVLGGAMGTGGTPTAGGKVDETDWKAHHASLEQAAPYEHYAAAYRLGDEAHRLYGSQRRWDQLEPELGAEWPRLRGASPLQWDAARDAARSAWNRRAERPGPGAADQSAGETG
jgi:hypothetical protein